MPTEHPNTVRSRQHFDLMADQYDELFVTHMHAYDLTHEMILTMLPFPHQSTIRVLELGTGTGNLTQKLLDRFPQSTAVGYDLSVEMLARARAKLATAGGRLQLHQGDISELVFPGPFDAVISAKYLYKNIFISYPEPARCGMLLDDDKPRHGAGHKRFDSLFH